MVEPVAEHEHVGDLRADVADVERDDPAHRPVEQRAHVDAGAGRAPRGGEQVREREPGVDHVLDEHDVAARRCRASRSFRIRTRPESGAYREIARKSICDVDVADRAGEVGEEDERALEHPDEHDAVGVVGGDRRPSAATCSASASCDSSTVGPIAPPRRGVVTRASESRMVCTQERGPQRRPRRASDDELLLRLAPGPPGCAAAAAARAPARTASPRARRSAVHPQVAGLDAVLREPGRGRGDREVLVVEQAVLPPASAGSSSPYDSSSPSCPSVSPAAACELLAGEADVAPRSRPRRRRVRRACRARRAAGGAAGSGSSSGSASRSMSSGRPSGSSGSLIAVGRRGFVSARAFLAGAASAARLGGGLGRRRPARPGAVGLGRRTGVAVVELVEPLLDHLERQEVVLLLVQDPAQPVDVGLVELPVARRGALGVDEALALEEPDLRDRDVGELLPQHAQHLADREVGGSRPGAGARAHARLPPTTKIRTNRPIWISSRCRSGASSTRSWFT